MLTTAKRVRRKTVEPERSTGRHLIIELGPGDIITFREERRRTTYELDIASAYHLAAKKAAQAERERKAQERRLARM